MYSANKPSADELPTTRQLIRSTAIALVAATVILITAILPAEYGIDPTGIGRVFGLTQMGQIKFRLANESSKEKNQAAMTKEPAKLVPAMIKNPPLENSGEIKLILMPGQDTEVKLEMLKGSRVDYHWSTNGGELFYDTHGEPYKGPKNFFHRYEKGRALEGKGVLEAAFDGHHGWYWKNTSKKLLEITLKAKGGYIKMKRLF